MLAVYASQPNALLSNAVTDCHARLATGGWLTLTRLASHQLDYSPFVWAHNPDFYRAQAMRMSTYNKPRIICSAELFEKYIALPRGCEEALLELLDNSGADYDIVDKTNPGDNIDVSFNGTLREEQQTAADALLVYNNGVLSAATAFGKTVVASYLIGQRKTNTLILVHTQPLMDQWKSSLEQFLVVNEPLPETPKIRGRKKELSHIGLLGAGKDTLRNAVNLGIR